MSSTLLKFVPIIKIICEYIYKLVNPVKLIDLIKSKHHERKNYKDFYPQIKKRLNVFSKYLDDRRCDTLTYLIVNYHNEVGIPISYEDSQLMNLCRSHRDMINAWFLSLSRQVSKCNFQHAISDFGHIIFYLNSLYITFQKQYQIMLNKGNNDSRGNQFVENWNTCLEDYGRFIYDWKNQAKEINTAYKKRFFPDEFEQLRKISIK